jgi:hypothetical protein
MTKLVTKKHETREGEILVRKIKVNEQDYQFVKDNIDLVTIDVTNNVPKYYKNGDTISLARALLLNRRVKPTKRIRNLSGDPYDLRVENLSYK